VSHTDGPTVAAADLHHVYHQVNLAGEAAPSDQRECVDAPIVRDTPGIDDIRAGGSRDKRSSRPSQLAWPGTSALELRRKLQERR